MRCHGEHKCGFDLFFFRGPGVAIGATFTTSRHLDICYTTTTRHTYRSRLAYHQDGQEPLRCVNPGGLRVAQTPRLASLIKKATGTQTALQSVITAPL
jgi:hypothetical protein